MSDIEVYCIIQVRFKATIDSEGNPEKAAASFAEECLGSLPKMNQDEAVVLAQGIS